MKKILSVLAILLAVVFSSVAFSSCSSDDGTETSSFGFSKDTYMTVVGRSGKVSFNGSASSWNSSNDFIASVESDGTITANHVGKCEITASAGRQSAKCTIDVEPIYTTYTDPLIKWGASKADVKAYEKRNLQKEDDKALYYTIDKGAVKGLSYNFEDGKLKAVLVVIDHEYNTSIATEMAAFLKERYRVISVSSKVSYFSDGKDQASSSTLVIVQLDPSGYRGMMSVYYMPYTD